MISEDASASETEASSNSQTFLEHRLIPSASSSLTIISRLAVITGVDSLAPSLSFDFTEVKRKVNGRIRTLKPISYRVTSNERVITYRLQSTSLCAALDLSAVIKIKVKDVE